MLKVVVVDDEKMAREVIINMAKNYMPDCQILGEATNVSSAYSLIKLTQPNLVFLDIHLPDGTGFDLLNKFEEKLNFRVVFITAYEEYAVKAFRFSALDYLLKPIDPVDFETSIRRVRQNINLESFNQNLNTFRNIYKPGNFEHETILFNTSHEVRPLLPNEIIRIAGDGNYCNVYLVAGEVLRLAKTLNWVENLLASKGFVRTHKQHIVNMFFIRSFLKNEQVLLLADGTTVPVSFRKKSSVVQALQKITG